METGERTIVGVNRFQSGDQPIELLQIDESSGAPSAGQAGGPARAARITVRCGKRWTPCGAPPKAAENTMPRILDAVRAYATLGEICDALRDVFGTYQETAHL